jgi:L-ascorbate metabolism protein UlaG (beta-lactamase superfamily)
VTLTPCKHWGARLFTDTHRGYGGYVIRDVSGVGGQSVYHSGDTAYFGGFREIGERLGPIDVALMPIGAYFPDSYRAVHTSPEEGLQGFVDVGARWMVPMHFGTFLLGREPFDEPPVRLMAEARRRGLDERVRVLAEGETMAIGRDGERVRAGLKEGDVLALAASNRV